MANHATWSKLVARTNRNFAGARSRCAKPGWHACYDRRHHQVTLWKHGRLWNSWLVRGGASNHKTRRGVHPVYWRDKDHVSSLYGSPMPYSQFFDGGQALHGSGLMVNPWEGHSHGCVNLYIEDARQLWRLTANKRLVVHVYGAWD
ncbi:MAG TPA: L,D-transpeptidase [Nocardioidaceae bacterium]|nr:L,D-transpeptidase [Nocardioidaceae bacterium]